MFSKERKNNYHTSCCQFSVTIALLYTTSLESPDIDSPMTQNPFPKFSYPFEDVCIGWFYTPIFTLPIAFIFVLIYFRYFKRYAWFLERAKFFQTNTINPILRIIINLGIVNTNYLSSHTNACNKLGHIVQKVKMY